MRRRSKSGTRRPFYVGVLLCCVVEDDIRSTISDLQNSTYAMQVVAAFVASPC